MYCGTCAGLGAHHGLVWRATLSYDGVFVAAVVDALSEDGAGPSRTRCPALPIVHRDTLDASSVAIRFASAVQLLLVDQWVGDRAADGRAGMRLARKLTAPQARRAGDALSALGVDITGLARFDEAQSAVERGAPDPEAAAAPTAAALALLFGAIAALPGVAAERSQLERLGAALGRAIYWIDALEDLEADVARGAFNPCVAGGAVDAPRVRTVRGALARDLSELEALARGIPWRRHGDVIEDILCRSLARRGRAALDASTPRSVPARWWRLAWRPLVVLGAMLWGWLCALPRAFAQLAPRADAADASDAADANADAGLPELDLSTGDVDAADTPSPAPSASGPSTTPYFPGRGCAPRKLEERKADKKHGDKGGADKGGGSGPSGGPTTSGGGGGGAGPCDGCCKPCDECMSKGCGGCCSGCIDGKCCNDCCKCDDCCKCGDCCK